MPNYVVLHSFNIKIIKALVTIENGDQYEINQIKYEPKLEYIYLIHPHAFKTTSAIVEIEYEGIIGNNMRGLYKSSYIDAIGDENWVYSTQFECIYARHVFPCFDEQHLKSTFTLTIDVDNQFDLFSNMNQRKRSNIDLNTDRVLFETSPLMSTYTLAFVIGPYSKITNRLGLVSLIVPHDKEEESNLGLQVATKAMKVFESKLGIKYSLDKLDLIAIPESEAGAMENCGLVTFNQAALLVNDYHISEYDKDLAFSTITHELSHQYFGNLCTTYWWDTLWLNEGIAKYLSTINIHGVNIYL
jgi:aminopeptidase N